MTQGLADKAERIAAIYRRFAEREARGRSPIYEALATAVAADAAILHFLAALPEPKWQPNLLFAAVRHLHGTPPGWQAFRAWLIGSADAVRAVMLARSTQTNEPRRCAVLLPVLAGLRQPLALLEVGASAGLCLLPDRYAYNYDGHRIPAASGGADAAPEFACHANPGTPLPVRPPQVVWRAGLDLNPIDVHDATQTEWLETLVWPGQEDRLDGLRGAIEVARRDPPPVAQGDLRQALPALAGQAPAGATLVVFHTAVLAYVADPEHRRQFAETVRRLNAVWIANETPGLFPEVSRVLPKPWPAGCFLLSVDGRPVAWTEAHGRAIDWLPDSAL